MEEIRGVRSTGKGEIPTGMEEQNIVAETMHHESVETGPYAVRSQSIRGGETWQKVRGESYD